MGKKWKEAVADTRWQLTQDCLRSCKRATPLLRVFFTLLLSFHLFFILNLFLFYLLYAISTGCALYPSQKRREINKTISAAIFPYTASTITSLISRFMIIRKMVKTCYFISCSLSGPFKNTKLLGSVSCRNILTVSGTRKLSTTTSPKVE
jgi:hypothetical protein